MMYGLEKPKPLAGSQVQSQEAISKQAGADAVAAPVVIGRRSQRKISDPSFFVDREFAPRVHSADVLPRVLVPDVVAELAWMRESVEAPNHLAGQHVKGAN